MNVAWFREWREKRDPYLSILIIYQQVTNKNHLTLERLHNNTPPGSTCLPAQIGALPQAGTHVLDFLLSPGPSKLPVYNARLQGHSVALSTRVLPQKSDSTSENQVTCQLQNGVKQGACPHPRGSWHASPQPSLSGHHPQSCILGHASLKHTQIIHGYKGKTNSVAAD